MTIYHIVAVGIGGFIGASIRFYLSGKLNPKDGGAIPYGTLVVNLLGSFLLGYIVQQQMEDVYLLFIGTGFLGAFTTFSTFHKELMELKEFRREWILYFTITYIGGLCLAYLGYLLGK